MLDEPVTCLILPQRLLLVEVVLPAAQFLLQVDLVHGLLRRLVFLNLPDLELVVGLLHIQLLLQALAIAALTLAHGYFYYC